MPELQTYDRERAVAYARRWARDRNPLFYDFTGGGGNCTNFVSQCLLAGCCQMNFAGDFGWYYITAEDRAAAWTGVEFFRNFLVNNADNDNPVGEGLGPFGSEVGPGDLELGDVIQLGREDGDFYHSLLVTGFSRRGYLVSAQSNDALDRPLNSYDFRRIRYLHIDGYRTDKRFVGACFEKLINGESLGI